MRRIKGLDRLLEEANRPPMMASHRIVVAVILLIIAMALFVTPCKAHDDLFWYAYPMPQAYLYVQDPVRYALWSANYGHRQAYVPARHPVYRPAVLIHDRSRFRRRACEIRILSSFH